MMQLFNSDRMYRLAHAGLQPTARLVIVTSMFQYDFIQFWCIERITPFNYWNAYKQISL